MEEKTLELIELVIESIKNDSEMLTPIKIDENNDKYIMISSCDLFSKYLMAYSELEIFKENEEILKNVKDFSKAIKNMFLLKDSLVNEIKNNNFVDNDKIIDIIENKFKFLYGNDTIA